MMTVEVDELQFRDGHTHALESAPKRIPLDATGTADPSGNALLVFDRVPQGESWDLYRLVVGGVQWSTAAAGTAVVYRTSSQASTASPGESWACASACQSSGSGGVIARCNLK